METCPITGQPLYEPGMTVHPDALITLRTQTNNLVGLMETLDERLAGAGRPERAVRTSHMPGSKPPLSVGLLDAIDDHRDTIEAWAWNIMQHVNPSFRFPRLHDWGLVQAVYQQHLRSLTTWEYAPAMCDELTDALTRLNRIIDPTDQTPAHTTEDLPDRTMTMTPAIQAVQLLTGKPLPRHTVYSWERRGHLVSTGDPKQYSIRDLLTLLTDTPKGT